METLAKSNFNFFLPKDNLRLLANYKKLKMNSKNSRKYFAEINMELLLSRKTNMHLSTYEIHAVNQ
jgi:hypothetical protein